jgi:hypothetical protein
LKGVYLDFYFLDEFWKEFTWIFSLPINFENSLPRFLHFVLISSQLNVETYNSATQLLYFINLSRLISTFFSHVPSQSLPPLVCYISILIDFLLIFNQIYSFQHFPGTPAKAWTKWSSPKPNPTWMTWSASINRLVFSNEFLKIFFPSFDSLEHD